MASRQHIKTLMKQAKKSDVPAIDDDEQEIILSVGQVARQTHNCIREYVIVLHTAHFTEKMFF